MIDDCFSALSNTYRREIIKLLKWKNMSVGEIANHFNISQPSISRHLEILKHAEIVTSKKEGNKIIYSLNLSVMDEIQIQLLDLFSRNSKSIKRKTVYEN
ncbi:MAG: autorepressor SdpR family transcription factor [Chordicoccus sp.]|jgi:ArsR family transcriptional regulator